MFLKQRTFTQLPRPSCCLIEKYSDIFLGKGKKTSRAQFSIIIISQYYLLKKYDHIKILNNFHRRINPQLLWSYNSRSRPHHTSQRRIAYSGSRYADLNLFGIGCKYKRYSVPESHNLKQLSLNHSYDLGLIVHFS